MEEMGAAGQGTWPAPLVAVMSMDTARRDEILAYLGSAKWDLVILEEIGFFARSRWTLLKTVLSNGSL